MGRFTATVASLTLAIPLTFAAPTAGADDERAANDADFYATLDLSRPELAAVKAAVDQGDYPAADVALQEFYASRETPVYTSLEGDAGAIPTAEEIADGVFRFDGGQVRDYYDDDNGRIDVDWDDLWDDWDNPPVNAQYAMNRFLFYSDLVEAYLALPDDDPRRDEIATAWMQIAQDFIADKGDEPIGTPPNNRLTEGIRLRYWLDAFSVFKDSPAVSAPDLVTYVDYMRQSAREIQLNIESHYGNNWYVSLARSIYIAATYLPEFNDATTWRFKAMSAADRYIDRNVRSDGVNYEPAINYHNYALDLIGMIQEFGELNGDRPFNTEELSFLQLQAEALAAVSMPDFTVPLFGDTQSAELDFSGAKTVADEFDRDDIEWVATGGSSGTKPSWESKLYPESFAVLRSGWDEDDQYMFVANQDSDYAASHRHPDDLSVVAYAYGRPLIVDPGAYSYTDSDTATWLRRTTEAHNTVEVGGVPQPRTTPGNPLARRSLQWYSNDGFDFYQGMHEDYQPITHNRSVFSPKPGFWIVSDVLAGSPGEDDYRQLWHFPADAPVSTDAETEAATAGFGDVPGVAIVPVDPDTTTTNVHPDGHVADGRGNLHSDVDYVSMSQTTSGPATFDTLLYPGDAGEAPSVSTDRIPLTVSDTIATALQVNLPEGATGTYYLSHEDDPTERAAGDFSVDGRLFYVEKDDTGDVTRLSFASGRELVDGDTTLVSSATPINDLSVEYNGDQLDLSTGEPLEDDLTVYAPDVNDVTLNGVSVTFRRDGDAVTVSEPEFVTGGTLIDETFGSVYAGGVREWTFSDGNAERWQPQRGMWSVDKATTGLAYHQTDRRAASAHAVVPADLDDVSVTADVTAGVASAGVPATGVVMRYQDPRNYYSLQLRHPTPDTSVAAVIAIVDGERTVLASEKVQLEPADSHRLSGMVRGDRITFEIDGDVAATARDNSLATGGAGLYTHRTGASFDDVAVDASTVWDFDDNLPGAWRGRTGSWTAADGVYQQTDTGQVEGMAIAEQSADDVDYAVTASLGTDGSSTHAYGVALRMHDARTYYMARIYENSDGAVAELYKIIGGRLRDFDSGPRVQVPLDIDLSKPHRLRASASGDVLKFWIDDELVASAVDGEIPTGGVGLQAHRAKVSFDDISVTKLTDTHEWTASRGYFEDSSESLRMASSGLTRSQLDLATTRLWDDYIAKATFQPTDWSGEGEIGLTVRSTKDTLGYRCVLVDTGSGTFARIERFAGGSRATDSPVVIAEEPVDFSTNDPLAIDAVVRGSKIELWLDGQLIAEARDTLIQRGGVSIVGSGVDTEVTDVRVVELVEP